MDAMDHQDYPFEELVDKLAIPRSADRNPLFDVMFVFNKLEELEIQNSHLTLTHYKESSIVAKFDFSIWALDDGNDLLLIFEYSTRLFKPQSVRRIFNFFKAIAAGVLNDPDILIRDINIIPMTRRKNCYGILTIPQPGIPDIPDIPVIKPFMDYSAKHMNEPPIISLLRARLLPTVQESFP